MPYGPVPSGVRDLITENSWLSSKQAELKIQFTKPLPKEKYAICVCEEKPLFFFISSNPRTRFVSASQLKVTATDLSFLRKNSYINTAEVVTCVIPHTCTIIKNFGSIPEHIKQQINIFELSQPYLAKL